METCTHQPLTLKQTLSKWKYWKHRTWQRKLDKVLTQRMKFGKKVQPPQDALASQSSELPILQPRQERQNFPFDSRHFVSLRVDCWTSSNPADMRSLSHQKTCHQNRSQRANRLRQNPSPDLALQSTWIGRLSNLMSLDVTWCLQIYHDPQKRASPLSVTFWSVGGCLGSTVPSWRVNPWEKDMKIQKQMSQCHNASKIFKENITFPLFFYVSSKVCEGSSLILLQPSHGLAASQHLLHSGEHSNQFGV